MRQIIVEDRVLARLAVEAVGWNAAAEPAELSGIAFGQVAVALRVMGIAMTDEVARTLRDDIALILADPDALARAWAQSPARDALVPANANGPSLARRAVG